jgi:very-short-patch-repair endonuclease
MGFKPPYDPPKGGINTRFLIKLLLMGFYKDKELVRRARVLRSNMTKAEIILWSRLRSRQVNGYKFRRQQPILGYIVDFYCNDLKLIIEVDGEIHSLNEKPEYDLKRDNLLKANGYKILRLSNLEVETEIYSAINKIILYMCEICPPSRGTTGGLNYEKPRSKGDLSPFQGDHRGSEL